MTTFTLMRGISGSGKSTIARAEQKETGAVVVCRDDLRLALYGVAFGPPIDENFISIVEHDIIEAALQAGVDVISDNTNLKPYIVEERIIQAKNLNAIIEINEVDVDLKVALDRNRYRADDGGRFVPENVIHDQWRAFYKHQEKVYEIYNRYTLGDTRI